MKRELDEARTKITQLSAEAAAFESQKKMFEDTLESMGKLNQQLKEEMGIHRKKGEQLKALQKLILDSLATLKHH